MKQIFYIDLRAEIVPRFIAIRKTSLARVSAIRSYESQKKSHLVHLKLLYK
jgi:hypothetical protein